MAYIADIYFHLQHRLKNNDLVNNDRLGCLPARAYSMALQAHDLPSISGESLARWARMR